LDAHVDVDSDVDLDVDIDLDVDVVDAEIDVDANSKGHPLLVVTDGSSRRGRKILCRAWESLVVRGSTIVTEVCEW